MQLADAQAGDAAKVQGRSVCPTVAGSKILRLYVIERELARLEDTCIATRFFGYYANPNSFTDALAFSVSHPLNRNATSNQSS
eukprot:18371-Heterococcus_DN1.PRE.5